MYESDDNKIELFLKIYDETCSSIMGVYAGLNARKNAELVNKDEKSSGIEKKQTDYLLEDF